MQIKKSKAHVTHVFIYLLISINCPCHYVELYKIKKVQLFLSSTKRQYDQVFREHSAIIALNCVTCWFTGFSKPSILFSLIESITMHRLNLIVFGSTCDFIISILLITDFKITMRSVVSHVVVILFASLYLVSYIVRAATSATTGKMFMYKLPWTCDGVRVISLSLQLLAFCMIVTATKYKFNNMIFHAAHAWKYYTKSAVTRQSWGLIFENAYLDMWKEKYSSPSFRTPQIFLKMSYDYFCIPPKL